MPKDLNAASSTPNQQESDRSASPHSWISIEPCSDDQGGRHYFEASFCFILEGIAHTPVSNQYVDEEKMRANVGEAAFESVLEALYPGQRLEFMFRTFRSVENRPVLHWNIIGKTRSETLEEARRHAEKLWESVALMLASQPSYRFRPTNRTVVDEDLDWSYTLTPRTVAIGPATLAMGFQADESSEDEMPVLLPLLDPQPAGPLPLVAILSSLPINLDLCVALEPILFDMGTRKKLVAVKQSLQHGSAACNEFPSGRPVERDVIATHLPSWEVMIEYWLAHLKAVRIHVELQSSNPITAGLLGLIGQAIHPQYSFEADSDTLNGKVENLAAVHEPRLLQRDLRGLIHNDQTLLPTLFPDVRLIGELDLPKSYPLPPSRLQRKGIQLGTSNGDVIRLGDMDRLRHNYIIGATGSGKSTLLLNLVVQDIQAGRGVCLIDPHGDLYEEVIARIPKERATEVVLFNPSDYEWVVGLNFLESTTRFPDIEQSRISNEMISIFDRLYDLRQTGGPMFEQYMRNALMLVMSSTASGGTLMDVPLLLENPGYRKALLETCPNPLIVSFWKKQAEKAGGEAALENITPYITSKLNQFTHNPLMRRIIGQKKSTIRFREIMDQGGILLVNLSKGLLSEKDVQLLGMLVMGKLFQAALGRIELPRQQRKTFNVYVDEFQNFATATVGDMLSEARKFGLCLTLANQHLAQLHAVFGTDDVKDAVLGNVGNMLLFRLGVLDAEGLEKFTLPWLSKQDLQYLPDFHVVARLLSDHVPIKPFVFKTDSPQAALEVDLKNLIVEHSRIRDTRPAATVDRAILEGIRDALVLALNRQRTVEASG